MSARSTGFPRSITLTIKPRFPSPNASTLRNASSEKLRLSSATAATGLITPGPDLVRLPLFEAFRDKESYYATALHELSHWTSHKNRLDHSFNAKKFGDHGYAREELVAELGAAFLCADLGITPEIRDDHAAYLGHWLKVLSEDKRAIFSAAAHAQRASDFLHGLQQDAPVFYPRQKEPSMTASPPIDQPRLALGIVVSTPGVLAACTAELMTRSLARHLSGDWGSLCKEDAATNDEALVTGERILSTYPIDPEKPCKGFGENTRS